MRENTDILAGELNAIVEQVDDLFFAKVWVGCGVGGGSGVGRGNAAIGGGACSASLGAFELVVVGAQK